MNYRAFGRTGVQVSPLCLGAWQFGQRTPKADALRMVDEALAAGINFIDTASGYGRGTSEEILGEALQGGKRARVFLATKFTFGVSRNQIIEQCEASLRRLRTDFIDLYQFHSSHPTIPIDESLRALDDLVRAGRFREDLLHRLRGCVLYVPALRERADIGQLLDRLLSDAGASPDRLPTAVRNRLLAYAWPGNVRELRHAVRLAVAVSGDGDALAWEDFSLGTDAPSQPSAEPSTAGSPATWQQSKSEAAADALRRTGGNMTAAAKLLGIGRATMYRWMGRQRPFRENP